MAEVGLVGRVVEGLGRTQPLAGTASQACRSPRRRTHRAARCTTRSTVPDRSPSSAREVAGVALADLRSGGAGHGGSEHVVEVRLGELDPAGLELDADGAPAEEGGLDDGGADRRPSGRRRAGPGSSTRRRCARRAAGSILPGCAVQSGR